MRIRMGYVRRAAEFWDELWQADEERHARQRILYATGTRLTEPTAALFLLLLLWSRPLIGPTKPTAASLLLLLWSRPLMVAGALSRGAVPACDGLGAVPPFPYGTGAGYIFSAAVNRWVATDAQVKIAMSREPIGGARDAHCRVPTYPTWVPIAGGGVGARGGGADA